ncbi:MAG TPA: PLP-dependent aminotransferase family protein [Ktedonobacterales bacterium]|jgi:GntR family transcriptional regulator/MocR family aminotransferase|nr:PLP-dependent aminotransferase family protein [Ktedonobacterales bacterium]
MTLDLLITLDRSGAAAEGLTRQIYAQLRQAILSGRLRAGDRLPPSRALAGELDVARLTVATAYDWLRAEGYVAGRVGAGTFVAPVFEGYTPVETDQAVERVEAASQPLERAPGAETQPSLRPPLTAWARRIQAIPLIGAGSMDGGASGATFDFRPSVGAADLLPWARWRRIVAWQDAADPLAELRAQARESAARAGRWDALLGPLETRAAIAAWLRRSRAVRCDPDQLLIASSVQQVLALLARLLVEPGQPLLVEDPSYIGFHAAFLAEGAALRGVPVDASGIRVEALPEPADPAAGGESADARLLIVTPSHQYPMGVTLSLERRVALIEWARRAGATLVEDDYDGELRLEGQPLEALRGLDERDEVIYLGTFAKALYPAGRLAFAALPRWLIEPVARARAASDRHPAWRDALAIARFIEAGELERHLARMRRVYRGRRDALVAALREELGEIVQVGPAEAGIHLLALLPEGTDDVALAERAREQGLAIAPLSPHYQAQARPGLLLGFGAMGEEQLAEGVRRLAPLARAAASGLQSSERGG